ncbi:sugar phosphate isomerase/epimerase [Phycisphaeraceae bacterium D3-23]
MPSPLTRRDLLKSTPFAAASLAAGCATSSQTAHATQDQPNTAPAQRWQHGASPWPICLDSATIRPSALEAKIRIAADAGYDAFEPWEGELHDYEQQGGNLQDLGQRIRDAGLFVPSVIGLWGALPPTREQFDASLENTRRRMRQASDIGAEFVQLVPQPSRPWTEFDPKWAADRYRELLDIGINDYNIKPSVVFVEFLEGAKRMGQAAAIALDADHPDATIIPDLFHMHIGDSGFNGLKHLSGDFFSIFQYNDAPADPPKDQLEDRHRVYPGDGTLPLTDILRDLKATGFKRCVSLELYNPSYWEQDHQTLAQTGLEKTLDTIRAAGV